MRKETVLTICAHNDDQIVGAGGTLAKYARQGKIVKTIICSFGENANPYLKREVIIEQRVKESLEGDKIMGGSGILYLGLKEGNFREEFVNKKIKRKLQWIIKKEGPSKIFTHNIDDLHPDHKAVYALIMEIISEEKIPCEVFGFDVWTLFNFRYRDRPRLVVDVSRHFKTKLKAFRAHKSQRHVFFILLEGIFLRAALHGWRYGYRYAEVFYKLN